MKPSTNSKEHFPVISKAKGKYCWDIDGNKYMDFTGSNLTTILGYRPIKSCVPNYPGVSNIENKLSTLLSTYTDTNYFRYYKNGSDAVNNAIRLARHIIKGHGTVCFIGYSGSNDSYVQTFNPNGIPLAIDECMDNWINYDNLNYQVKDFNKLPKQADIIVFESRYADIADNIKANIRIMDCLKEGIIALVSREEYPKIIDEDDSDDCYWDTLGDKLNIPNSPDFVCLGKSIANGSAMAVLTGKDEYMQRIDDVYYSTTFGCNQDAMLEAIRTIKDFDNIKEKYFKLWNYAKDILPNWFSATPEQIKEFTKHGVLFNGYWQIMACHTIKDINYLKNIIDKVLPK